MPAPLPTPAERFAILLLGLSRAVWTRNHFGLPMPLINLIIDRIRGINQCIIRIAARIQAGSYAPRRSGPRRPGVRRPRQPSKLPREPGWLLKLVPEAIGYHAQLEHPVPG